MSWAQVVQGIPGHAVAQGKGASAAGVGSDGGGGKGGRWADAEDKEDIPPVQDRIGAVEDEIAVWEQIKKQLGEARDPGGMGMVQMVAKKLVELRANREFLVKMRVAGQPLVVQLEQKQKKYRQLESKYKRLEGKAAQLAEELEEVQRELEEVEAERDRSRSQLEEVGDEIQEIM